MSEAEMSSNKHVDLHNAISLKTEMLRKNIQTRSSRCLSPVKIFSSTSSTSVPTHVSCMWPLCWKDVQIKGSIRASVTLYPISQGGMVELQSRGSHVIQVDDINTLKYHGTQSTAEDKRHHYASGKISPTVITCDMRPLSFSIGALCNFRLHLEPFPSSYYLQGFGN